MGEFRVDFGVYLGLGIRVGVCIGSFKINAVVGFAQSVEFVGAGCGWFAMY